jgi:glycosyltransferase involved in cell wall biosynthesis
MLKILVAPNHVGHHYHRTIYDTLGDDLVEEPLPRSLPPNESGLRTLLRRGDLFHLHWPEWFPGRLDLAETERLVSALRDAEVPILWTMHNLLPHSKHEAGAAIYRAWAAAVDAIAHHSHWGLEQARRTYQFREDAIHAVIHHPHFGQNAAGTAGDRSAVERDLGLRSDVLRLAIVGAPRKEKRLEVVCQAMLACRRDDLELLILSLGPDDHVPQDRRIRAFPYAFQPRENYERRLRAVDVVVLPFSRTGMLTTGTVGDVVGHGLPALASDWPFLREVLGDAAICYGTTAQDLTGVLETLGRAQLERAAARSRELRSRYDPARVGRQLVALMRDLS